MPTLRFIESDGDVSVYRDEHGDTVFLGPGGVRLYDGVDEALDALGRVVDRDTLESVLVEPDDLYYWSQCHECAAWTDDDDLTSDQQGDSYCDECCDEVLTRCTRCEEHVHIDDTQGVGWDGTACPSCFDGYTSYCDECDETYWMGESDHASCRDCDCEAPNQTFSIGARSSTLSNDEPYDVTIAEGLVSAYGIAQVYTLLATGEIPVPYSTRFVRSLARIAYQIDDAWKNERGTFPKRLRSEIYKQTGYRLPATQVEEIGNIARAHSTGVEVSVEITRALNGDAAEYAHEDSCWWTDYAYSRCTLKQNHGFGLRSMEDGNYGRHCDGRAWVIPMSADEHGILRPTGGEAEAYVLFNGYEALDEMRGPRVMSAITGWNSTRIDIPSGWRMYVNGDTGHLIATAEVLDAVLSHEAHLTSHMESYC